MSHKITRSSLTNIYGECVQGTSCSCSCGHKWIAGTVAYNTNSPYLCPMNKENEEKVVVVNKEESEWTLDNDPLCLGVTELDEFDF